MSRQRPLVIAAAALGALALLGAGVWFGRSSAPADTAGPAAGLPAEREAAYRRLIDEANARIARQNQMLAAAQQSKAGVEPAASEPPRESPAPIDANAAAQAAYRVAPGARLSRPPELVSFRGQPAYEVVLDRGTIYVDASTAAVLHDGTGPSTRAAAGDDDDEREAPLAANGKHGRKRHDKHHEEHEDDDD